MTRFKLLLKCRGSVLVGGHGAVPTGLHGSHATDGDGRPVLPATAIRGALRETLEALLRGADLHACDAGTGREPGVSHEDAAGRACALDEGRPCVACRLFGGGREGLAERARMFSGLVLGDGRLHDTAARWMLRPGVSIARRERSARDRLLFIRRTPATGARFLAEGRLLDPSLRREFEAAVRATTHLGAGRSRGLARVDMELEWDTSPETVETPALTGDSIRVRVTLQTPAIFGSVLARENLRDTRHEVPGSALRGAVGFALARVTEDPQHDPDFKALLDEGGARFGFLYPIDAKGKTREGVPSPLPITAAACKFEGRTHGIVDTLLDRIVTAHLTKTDEVLAITDASARTRRCPKCDGPLRGIAGYRRCEEGVAVRAATRASIEREAQSVREGALFTEVRVEPGTTFEGTIRGISEKNRDVLAKALTLPLSVGRSLGAGRGQVSVEVSEPPRGASLVQRGEAFDQSLRAHLERARMSTARVGRLVAISLLSPWVPMGGGDEWEDLAAWFPGGTCFLRARRFIREGAWDQLVGTMRAWQAVAAGAVYVIELPEGTSWREHIATLEQIEREGIGAQRHQGYGEVCVFDRAFVPTGTRGAP